MKMHFSCVPRQTKSIQTTQRPHTGKQTETNNKKHTPAVAVGAHGRGCAFALFCQPLKVSTFIIMAMVSASFAPMDPLIAPDGEKEDFDAGTLEDETEDNG